MSVFSPKRNLANLNEGQKRIDKYIFSLKKCLGKGSYAQVYLGRTIFDQNLTIAVKVISKQIFANKYNIKNIQSEIDIMKKVSHENIVKMLDIYQTNNNMYIITEFCEEGDLHNYLKRKKRLTENQAIKFLKNIVDGFEYLCSQDIVHRDLKPANILISKGNCKISDFGFARNLDFGQNTVLNSIVGTPLYMSPQILKHKNYTNKSDLWSLGLIYYQMLHGCTPWIASNQMQLFNNICSKPITFDIGISQKSKDFIKKALKINQDDRMSWEEAFAHPLFSKTDIDLNGVNTMMRRLKINKYDDENTNQTNKFKSKSRSVKKKNNISRTPKARILLDLTPQKKSPWKK